MEEETPQRATTLASDSTEIEAQKKYPCPSNYCSKKKLLLAGACLAASAAGGWGHILQITRQATQTQLWHRP